MNTHDIDILPQGSERVDAYLARRRPEKSVEQWYAEGIADHIQIRDYFDVLEGTYNRKRWFLQWWDGEQWQRLCDLEPGSRPRMHKTFCYVVPEGVPS
jgi:hypothetical protein